MCCVNLYIVNLNIKKNNNMVFFVELLCSPCIVNVLIRRTNFVTSVVNLHQLQRISISPKVKKAYDLYFGCRVGDKGKSWAPHSC